MMAAAPMRSEEERQGVEPTVEQGGSKVQSKPSMEPH
jgi:hypothetical protein